MGVSQNSKLHPGVIDDAVSTEIPDEDRVPELYEIVSSHNITVHSLCGLLNSSVPCIKHGYHLKNFPKRFLENTEMGTDSFPKYKRRDAQSGSNTGVKKAARKEVTIDKSWIVPLSPWLLQQLNVM
ncbi:hypothetical protein RRG08_028182 [Elysia crispata]|uniref:Uncharacterized protein n=1 Tax=Elysia crispata TaxID=231223 RepID=A0AAE1B7T0_9GAST|nr:hypothetical protein RRG08_028182 [Elysia crispata]